MSRIELKSRDGLNLEATVDAPDAPIGSLVLCHPHPKMGGTMNAPLLVAISEELVRRGWEVLRFNFRGIGDSEGESSDGIAEVADALGALDLMKERGRPLAIAGWSFGAAVALRAAARFDGLVGAVAIAPAVRPREGITAGTPDDVDPAIPVLIVVGANDEEVSPDECEALAGRLPDARFAKEPGANHFFWAKYETLAGDIGNWLDERIERAEGRG